MMLLSEAANQQRSLEMLREALCAVKLVQQVIRWYLKVVNILKNRPKLHTGCLHSHYIHITIIMDNNNNHTSQMPGPILPHIHSVTSECFVPRGHKSHRHSS